MLGRIGEGGVAWVWRARDERLERDVAVKVLGHDEPAFRRRFTAEARRAAAVAHPNVVTVLDAFDEGDRSFIVMELVEGRALDTVARGGPLSPERVAAIVSQIAAALDAAHAQDVIHCDVKPANIVVDAHGTAKLADFGIARAAEDRAEPELVGMARYVAPEQVAGEEASPRSDIYGLGLVAYELIAGRPAFEGDDTEELLRRRVNAGAPRLRDARPEVAPALDAVVARALARDPHRRYASAGEFAAALRATAASHERTERLARMRPAPRVVRLPGVDRRRLLFGAGALAVAFATVGLLGRLGGTVFAGPVAVPDLRGRSYAEAEVMLRLLGLGVSRQDRAARQGSGSVIEQSPGPGTEMSRGSVATLVVAARPTAPKVEGMKRDDAANALMRAGFGAPVFWGGGPAGARRGSHRRATGATGGRAVRGGSAREAVDHRAGGWEEGQEGRQRLGGFTLSEQPSLGGRQAQSVR